MTPGNRDPDLPFPEKIPWNGEVEDKWVFCCWRLKVKVATLERTRWLHQGQGLGAEEREVGGSPIGLGPHCNVSPSRTLQLDNLKEDYSTVPPQPLSKKGQGEGVGYNPTLSFISLPAQGTQRLESTLPNKETLYHSARPAPRPSHPRKQVVEPTLQMNKLSLGEMK